MERRVLEAIIYEREPPIARIILNRVDKANTKDSVLVSEVDSCLHEADRDKEIKVVIIKANGKGFCGGHVARWGPDENPYPDFGDTFEDLYKGTADLFLWPTLYLWEFPKPTISAIHGYCMGGGIYLGLLTDFCVASEDAYFQMPLAQSLGEPGGPLRRLITRRYGADDIGLDDDVGRAADHQQMFDIVAPYQHQTAPAIHRSGVNHRQSGHPSAIRVGAEPISGESADQPGGGADQGQNGHEREKEGQCLHTWSPEPAMKSEIRPIS